MVQHKYVTDTSTVVASNGVTSTEIEGEHVLLDIDEGIYYGLNSVGGAIWEELQEPTSVEAIVHAIMDAYDVEREECQEDVLALLVDLQDNGLVDVREA